LGVTGPARNDPVQSAAALATFQETAARALLPLDDERSDIIVFNQRFAKNLWKTTVVDSGNIVP